MKTKLRVVYWVLLFCLTGGIVQGQQRKLLRQDAVYAAAKALVKARAAQLPRKIKPMKAGITASRLDQSQLASNCFIPVDGSFTAIPKDGEPSTGPIALPFAFNLYGTSYNEVYINVNGTLSFIDPFESGLPFPFPYDLTPLVAPFWSENDIDEESSGQIYYKVTPTHLVVTWDKVGNYSDMAGRVNTFQVVIGVPGDPLLGANNVLFNYGDMQWAIEPEWEAFPSLAGVNGGDETHYMQLGRFSKENEDYDGPGGADDGIGYLKNKCFGFNVTTQTNIPTQLVDVTTPRLITVGVGQTVTKEFSFTAPEVGQTVSTVVDVNDLCNIQPTVTNGTVSRVQLNITGAACNVGIHFVTLTAADNGNPQQSTTIVLGVQVTADRPVINFPQPVDEDGDGRYPLLATSSGGEPIEYEVIGGLAHIEEDTVMVADGVGEVLVRAMVNDGGVGLPVFADVKVCLPVKQATAIKGDVKGCLSFKSNYSVDYVPGAIYHWSIDGGGTMEGEGPAIEVTWHTLGEHTVSVSYSSNCGAAGAARTLTVEVIVNPLSGAISKMIPVDGNRSLYFPVTFSWSPIERATSYDIYIWPEGTTRPDLPLINGVKNISYILYYDPRLEYGKTYHWQVVANGACAMLAGPVQKFGLRNLPDLVVKNIQIPAGGFSGQPITVKWEVKNQGTGSTFERPWHDKVILSLDQVPDNRDTVIAFAGSPSALNAGEGYTNTATFTLPNGINNKYFIFIEADGFDGVVEKDEDNNTTISGSTINVQLTPPPDLQVTKVVPPNNAFSGQVAEIKWTVMNAGPGRVLDVSRMDILYLSKEAVFQRDKAIQLGRYHVGDNLEKAESYTKTIQVKVPDTANGNYYVYVETDAGNLVYEHATENNNTGRSEVVNVILAPPVDLIVEQVKIPATGVSGERISLSWRVENAGGSATDNSFWWDSVFLSPTPEFNKATAIPVGRAPRRLALATGEGYQTLIDMVLPKVTGDYYVVVKADASNGILEYNHEDNNTGIGAGKLRIVSPDLIIGGIDVPATWVSGNTLRIDYTLKNNGNGVLINTKITDRLLLSTSATWNANNAILLKEVVYQTGNIVAGDDTVKQVTVLLPDGIAGAYYVYVQTDYKDTVYESGGDNNIGRSGASVAITPGPWADLQVSKVQANDTAAAGEATTISYTIVNKGNKATQDSAWKDKVYLSLKDQWDAGSAIFIRDILQKRDIGKEGAYSVETAIKLPGHIGDTTYYVYVHTNAEKKVYEQGDTTNNRGRSGKMYVKKYPPVDLVVGSVVAPVAGKSGSAISVKWTVQNKGAAVTLENQWQDGLYLSADTVFDAKDTLIKSYLHRGQLAVGGTYSDEQSIVLPNGVAGKYYLLVVTDVADVNNDADSTNNYGMVRQTGGSSNDPIPMGIELTPPADLVIAAFNAPEEGFSGQPIKVKWTIKNSGMGSTNAGSWTEKIYLSRDVSWDKDDLEVGHYTRMGALAPDGQYNDSLEVVLPNNYLGNYVLIFRSDVKNQVYEHGAEENLVSSLLTVLKDELSDLVVTNIRVPATGLAGEEVTVQWSLKNTGINPSRGYLQEGIYLSTDTIKDVKDVLAVSIPNKINLAPGAILERSAKIKLKEVSLGDYHVLIHGDVLDNIVEINDNNNIGASEQAMKVTVDELPIQVQLQRVLPENKEIYYRIEIADSLVGQSLLVSLQGDAEHGNNQIFLRHGEMPTKAVHDYAFGEPFKASQEIVVPALEAGTYYLLVSGRTGSNMTQTISLLASVLHFEVRSVEAAEGGNTGVVTVQVKGSKLGTVKKVALRNSTRRIEAKEVDIINPVALFARFDLEGAAEGVYDVVAVNDAGDSTALAGGFKVVAGTASGLETNVVTPPNTRPSNVLSLQVQFANTGNTDIINPVLSLTSLGGAPIALKPAELEGAGKELKLKLQEVDGPAGRLRPGAKGTIIVYAKATTVLGFMLEEDNR
jgi:hypothetical protein